jgi:hypothetical protein
MLLRGTELYRRKDELGLVESVDTDAPSATATEEASARQTYMIPHVVESPTFTRADWQQMDSIAKTL